MEQNSGGGPLNFLRRFLFPIVLGLVVIILFIVAVTKDKNDNDKNNEQANEQTTSQNSNQNQGQNQNSNGQQSENNNSGSTSSGNVTAKGTLKNSDNSGRGNYVVESNRGKIYISTKRDFSSLVGKEVTLNAQGNINQFTFLGFAEGQGVVAGTDTTAAGGGDTLPTASFTFDGKLMNSDAATKGNYMVVSGNTKLYLKSVRDYSSLVNATVTLTATGTINSFTNAKIIKK